MGAPDVDAWVGPLFAVLAVQIAASFLSRIAPTLAPKLALRVGWPVESVGYMAALITAGSAVFLLLGMPLLRRFGSVRCLQFGLAVGVFGALLSALPQPTALLVGSLLIGVSIGPPSSAGIDVLQRFAPIGHRNLLFSIKQSGVPLGGVLAGLLLPWLAQTLGVGQAIALSTAVAVLTLVAVQPLRRRVDTQRDNSQSLAWRVILGLDNIRKPLAVLVAVPALRRLGAGGACLGAGQASWYAFLVTFLVAELHWSLTAAGALFALMQITSALGRPVLGFLSDRAGGGIVVLKWSTVASALTTLALAFTTPAWPLWSIVTLAVIGGCTVASWNGVQFAEVARMAPRELLNETMTGATLLLLVSFVAGPALFGLIIAAGGGFGMAFGATALVTLAALIPLSRC